MTTSWDDLRRNARLLENDIDAKLISLNKINSSNGQLSSRNSDVASNVSKRTIFESLSKEVELLISKLTRINNEMTEIVEKDTSLNNGTCQHTLRRHREILRDYCNEFNRSCTNIMVQLQREDLLSGSSSHDIEMPSLNNRTKSTELLLKENERIGSCDRLLDEQISIAMSVKENVYAQRGGLSEIQKKVIQLSKKYPAINSLMQKIKFKKRKDTIVLAAVITSCLIFFFIFLMH
uniref:Golgi SNAP receptor complex member 1 n=1 Tax=Acrobeloides nanus TaxID=290746 RepID=A0A914BZE0_9BILA